MVLDKELLKVKDRILEINNEIYRAKSTQRKKQLLKHKHRLEKDVMCYMNYKYGIVMRKG